MWNAVFAVFRVWLFVSRGTYSFCLLPALSCVASVILSRLVNDGRAGCSFGIVLEYLNNG